MNNAPLNKTGGSMYRGILNFALINVYALLLACGVVHADALTPRQQDRLKDLDSETANAVVEVVGQLEKWQQLVSDAQKLLKSIKNTSSDLEEESNSEHDVLTEVFSIAEFAVERRELFDKFTDLAGRFEERVSAIQSSGTEIETDESIELTAEELRELSTAFSKHDAAVEMLDDIKRFIKVVSELKDPAAYFQSFADDKLTEFVGKARKWPGTEFTFRVEKPNPGASLFNPDANLKLVIQYQEGIEVSASGLYFEYNDKGLPLPKFEKVRPDEPNLSNLLNIGLDKLGDVIPENFDLPVTIKKVRFNDFNQPDGKVPPGSLSFDIVASFPMAEAFKAEIENVNIAPNGKVAAPNGLKFENSTIRIPLGTTGLDMFTINGAIRPKDPDRKHVTFGTKIVPAQTQNLLELKTEASFGFPLKRVDLKGTLLT
jgi:hypothetical protein